MSRERREIGGCGAPCWTSSSLDVPFPTVPIDISNSSAHALITTAAAYWPATPPMSPTLASFAALPPVGHSAFVLYPNGGQPAAAAADEADLPVAPRKTTNKRKRSACVSELEFCRMYNEVVEDDSEITGRAKLRTASDMNSPYLSRIRVWRNKRNHIFYDCSCGNRKPVQDLRKIERHTKSHDVHNYPCPNCDKVFAHHLQLNAHQKCHLSAERRQNGKENDSKSAKQAKQATLKKSPAAVRTRTKVKPAASTHLDSTEIVITAKTVLQ